MEQPRHKKLLSLKIAIVILLAIFTSSFSFFIIPNLVITILVAILTAVLAVTASFWILKPLDILTTGVRILSKGNFNHRFDIRSGDELEDVGNSFNLMADKLTQAFQNLEKDKDLISVEKNELDVVLSSVIDGIIALDFNKNIILLNKAAQNLTGFTKEEASSKPIDQLIHLFSDQEEISSKYYCQENFNQPLKLVGKNGQQTKVRLLSSQVLEGVPTKLGCILILHDLSKEEELEQMKFDFVSMASHELKTPLTSIIGYLSVFLNEYKSKLPKEEFDLLNKSLASAQQLLRLVQNLLSVNKIEKEQLSVSLEPLDYYLILSKAVEDLRSQANLKNIVLTLIPPSSPLPKVVADPLRIGEVITNLVANAINYTGAGGKVQVFTQTFPNEIITSVSDTGVGIPKEAIPHLFNKFFRVSNQLQKADKGTGLGLYIAKSIIEKLHGKIWVESEPGKGSKFCFTLPILTQSKGVLDSDKYALEAIKSGSLNY